MVVPSLLPETASIPRDIFCFPEQWSSSCLFSFYTRHNYIESPFYTVDDLRQGFLPVGLFERLVCKLLRFVNEQVYHKHRYAGLLRDEMICFMGNQLIRVSYCKDENGILLQVEGNNSVVIYHRVSSLINSIISSCMHSLLILPLLHYESVWL